MNRAKLIVDKSIAMLLIVALLVVSCSIPQSGPGRISSSALVSASGRAINLYLDDIRSFVEEDLNTRGILDGQDGFDIATRTLEEENGREYLEFTLETSQFTTAEEVFKAAEGLAPVEEIEKIKEGVAEAEERLFAAVRDDVRVLTPDQQEEFYNDLTALVIKSAVLLTAAVVYSFVPSAVLWGKVTAASAVAIAAGVVAASIMAIVEHYKSDIDFDDSFADWLENVAKEPMVYWGLASSVISISQSLNRGPVLTSIILVIFAIFGITDDAKTLLEKYDLKE